MESDTLLVVNLEFLTYDNNNWSYEEILVLYEYVMETYGCVKLYSNLDPKYCIENKDEVIQPLNV